MRKKIVAGAAATLTAIPAFALLGGGAAAAAGSGGVQVSNTETVQAYLDATGKLDVARVYEQVSMRGTGTVDLKNPVEVEGLRNLDAFGGFDVENGAMVGRYEVAGEHRLRAVSDYTKKLPLQVEVSYRLDGKRVAPEDVVGRSGRLEVRYTVRNVTGTTQPVSFDDGTGAKTTASEDVVIPMVGSLTTTLPAGFTNVASGEANIAGDGRGGTKLTFTMTLFGPIGAPQASFGYSANIVDGLIPKAAISALPVSPLDSPSFKAGAQSYKGGAETGVALTAGATEIDANLLKLRDGAATLLAGLIQLRDGAKKLDAGLGSQILPGSKELAGGAGELKDGTARLRAGAGDAKAGSAKLSDGAGQVAAGAGDVDAGAGRLAAGLVTAENKVPLLIDGLGQVADGLDLLDAGMVTLHGSVGQIPAKAKPLHEGITRLRAGIGTKEATGTLLYGVEQVRSGLATATAQGGSLDQLKGGVDQVQEGLAAGVAPGGGIDQLKGGAQAAQAADCGPICSATLDQVIAGLADLKTRSSEGSQGLLMVSGGLAQLKSKLSEGAAGLTQVECGLSNESLSFCPADKPGLLEGLGALDAGVTELVNGVVDGVQGAIGDTNDTSKDKTLRGGVHSLQGGIDEIGIGGMLLLDGLGQLSDGAGQLKAGAGRLASGAGQVADGAGDLDDGLGILADGAGELDNGAGRLRDGAGQLADGLGTAADGTSQIAEGLDEAAAGAPALQDGAQRLSTEGTTKLVDAGKETAADYGKKYALIEAGAQRASTEGMAYGAPADAMGFTAYSLEIAGVDGDGGRTVGQAAAALGLFGLAGGLLFWRRRLV